MGDMKEIKSTQKEVLIKMLRLNQDSTSSANNNDMKTWESSWKVLVYDKYCQDILAPLLHLSELRTHGITLNMLITNEREAVADVPAVYFVQPTRENIDRIVKDCTANLYDSFYLNFSTSLSRKIS